MIPKLIHYCCPTSNLGRAIIAHLQVVGNEIDALAFLYLGKMQIDHSR